MSRTHRKHEAPSKVAKRGPTPDREDRLPRLRKTHKQTRPNERAALRREFR